MLSFLGFSQAKFGVQIGSNFGSTKNVYTNASITETTKYAAKAGFLIGGFAEISASKLITIRPELLFIQKGGTYTSTYLGVTYKDKFIGNYIELPVNVTFNFEVGSGTAYVGAGPSIAYGISGKYVSSSSDNSPVETVKIKFDGNKNPTDNNAHLKSLDMGLGILAGYKLSNGLSFNVEFNKGISNIDVEDNSTTKTAGFSLRIGYVFGNK